MSGAQQQRFEWMDLARGLAVLLVILLHASAIPWMLGLDYPRVLNWVGAAFTPYRMPTLLVLSGVLLIKSLRKGWFRYYSGKFQLIFWPFAVWHVIAIIVGGGSFTDVATWMDGGYLWFLLVIGCCYLIAPLVKLVPAWGLALAMAVSGALVSEPFTERFLYYGAFFFVGAQLGQNVDGLRLITRRGRLIAMATALGWAVAVASLKIYITHELVYFALSVIGVVAVLIGVQKIGDNPVARFLRWVGRHSIVFYVAHFPVILLVCYFLIARGITNAWVVAAAGVTVATFASIALVRVRYIVPFNWLFEMPTPSREDWATVRDALRTPQPEPQRVAHPAVVEDAVPAGSAEAPRSADRGASSALRDRVDDAPERRAAGSTLLRDDKAS